MCENYAYNESNNYYGSLGKQQPGEFSSGNHAQIQGIINPSVLMNNVVSNLFEDANALGYTITEYTNNEIEQISTKNSNCRLIAVVTGLDSDLNECDYHFYMQHNDGTWSHKPGFFPISNKVMKTRNQLNSIVGNITPENLYTNSILTNNNIRAYANRGIYEGGCLKFFKITKPAVYYQHDSNMNVTQNDPGDYLETCYQITTGTHSYKINYTYDDDVFYFVPSQSRQYTIRTVAATGEDLDAELYDNSNNSPMVTDASSYDVNITYYLNAGSMYYIDIYSDTGGMKQYSVIIS